MTFSSMIEAQPRPVIVLEGFLVVLVIGFFDWLSGWDVSLFLFYAFPILFCAWYVNRGTAYVCAVLCGVVWFLANLSANNYTSRNAYVWAAVNRVGYFLFVAVGGTALKRQQEEMRGRMEAMVRARELEQEIVRVSEREQIRIGQDLHDGLCQNLAAIDCALACLRTDLEGKSSPESLQTAAAIQKLLQASIVEARAIARGIFPVQMDSEGLLAALQELVQNTNTFRQVDVTLQISGEVRILDPQVGMHLYRIAQEALSNAMRHARATHVEVGLTRDGAGCTLTIGDNGCGFRPEQPPDPGMGLRTMFYRARLINAALAVESAPSSGTLVRCTLPLCV